MKNMLQQYFPMIRTDEELMSEIKKSSALSREFYSWEEEARKEFIDFCTGAKGVKMMYDFVSKEILNPETVPERVDELLSLLLGQEVHVRDVLPNDGTRIADESAEYSCAAEPPVQCGVSHLSRRTEPLFIMKSYSRNDLSKPYTSLMETS